MKFEIITDTEDNLVLIVNSRVILITDDMSVVMNHIWDNYQVFMKRNKRLSEPVLMYPDLTKKEYKKVDKTPIQAMPHEGGETSTEEDRTHALFGKLS